MTKKEYDVIVIGAGPGGAPCAALLANRGMKILLIEKNDRAGGKAMSISNKGFTYELWPVAGGPRLNTRFEAVSRELDIEPEGTDPENIFTLYYRGSSGEYKPFIPSVPRESGQPDPAAMMGIIPWLELKPDDLAEVLRLGTDTAALSDKEIEDLDGISYHEFISSYRIPKSLYSYMAAQFNTVFVLPIDQVAASEGIKTLNEMMTDGAGFYSRGGYGRLFEKYMEAFKRDGGDVIFNSRVERVIIQDGRVRGVETDQGTFNAPVVISNAGIQPTVLKLAGDEHFDKSYIKYVKELVPSLGLMGTRYFLNKPFLETGAHIAFSDDSYWNLERSLKAESGEVPDEIFIFATVPSKFDPELAPAGKQCVLASTICPPDPEMKNTKAWWDKIDGMMDRVWPGFTQHIESKENYGTGHVSALTRDQVLPGIGGECIGLGQVAGQCGRHKPSARSPVDGLFFVGCDAGGYGCGTHQAVDSAINVAQLVQQYCEGE